MRSLLDINVLLSLLDSDHVDHERSWKWMTAEIELGWASCAITQNGFVRIISQPRYPNPVSPNEAIVRLASACNTRYHEFWTSEVSLLDERVVDHTRIHGNRQVADAYLLALATLHKGRFVTFDQSLSLSAVRGACPENLVVIL
jgi:toxin-antitoxin system PIN domain toxin